MLLKCQSCQSLISNTAKACPGCGAKRRASGFKLRYVVLGLVVLVVFAHELGQHSPPSSPAIVNSGFDGSVYYVERYLDRTLKDPDSYQSIAWGPVRRANGGYVVWHKYRAKNSFGGYVIQHQVFTLDADGNVVGVE